MDVEIPLEGLMHTLSDLVEGGDFEGAEAHLNSCLSEASQYEALLHLEFGRLYARWNKMSSAIAHLTKAAEIAHSKNDQSLLLQIRMELKSAKRMQSEQKP